MADGDQNLNRVAGPHQVEGLASVSDRVLRKKDRQKNDQQHKKKPDKRIEERLEEELNDVVEKTSDGGEGHIDYRA